MNRLVACVMVTFFATEQTRCRGFFLASLSCFGSPRLDNRTSLHTAFRKNTNTSLVHCVACFFKTHRADGIGSLFFAMSTAFFFFALVSCMERQLSDCSCDENAQNRIEPITTDHKFLREGSFFRN